ncbi:hypothetical protein [Methanobacterium sp. MBAC-LM]|uniref:hypothetical protein n=1 Tax=Methanobacterium sp. MBAC-LM TaxID=3412034 RepID=UPI003C71F959
MGDILKINKKTSFVIYIVLDTLFVGMGMGVPFFCILFGFPSGWYLSKSLKHQKLQINDISSRILKYATLTSLVTLAWMLIIWGPMITMLQNPSANFADFGIPLILYDPKLSFIGWIILMIFISPFLQLLMTVFASHVALWRLFKKTNE